MSQDFNEAQRGDSHVQQFEKNQFFQGKLMTARDMQAEQEYHAERLHTITRFATGKGILYGAEVSGVEETETELRVTLEPGVVIDGYGRPIVIEYTTTKTLPLPSGEELYLFLRYSETNLESVPVPEVRGASDEEFMANRTVETFELTYQESPPDAFDTVPDIDTSVPDGAESDTVLRALANRYHQRYRSRIEPVDDPAIFVGSFERTRDGSWIRGSDTVRRNLVYDNEMLYATIINHITDTANPHNISERGIGGEVSGGIDELRDVNERLRDIQDRLDTINRYVMRKTLKDEIRYFEVIADTFEEDDPEASQIAREIVDM
ncbi:MAG: hypothetical protein R3324_14220, partial [Halobacteriales archaeon]|nr:hypothetical protein [Halobacteriales archaeon]